MFTPFYLLGAEGLDTFFSIRFEYDGILTNPPHQRYQDGKVAHFDYVDTDVFSVHDLDDMLIDLGFQKINPLCYRYCIPDHTLDTGLRPLSNDVDLRQFVSYVPTHRELVVYICEIPPLNVANVPVSPEMVRKRPRSREPRS